MCICNLSDASTSPEVRHAQRRRNRPQRPRAADGKRLGILCWNGASSPAPPPRIGCNPVRRCSARTWSKRGQRSTLGPRCRARAALGQSKLRSSTEGRPTREVLLMPRGDGTGPSGMGPMTGRAAGYCAGYGAPGFASGAGWRGAGRGIGWGRGRGWRPGWGGGWGRGWRGYADPQFAAPAPPAAFEAYVPPAGDVDTHLAALQSQAERMRQTLSEIEDRIRALETDT